MDRRFLRGCDPALIWLKSGWNWALRIDDFSETMIRLSCASHVAVIRLDMGAIRVCFGSRLDLAMVRLRSEPEVKSSIDQRKLLRI